MSFYTTVVSCQREEVNEKRNKVVSLPLQTTPAQLLLCVSQQVHMSLSPPSPSPRMKPPGSRATPTPHHPTITRSSSPATNACKWESPKTKVPPWRGYPPLSPTHGGLSGSVKGTILGLFTAAALNEVVEGLF